VTDSSTPTDRPEIGRQPDLPPRPRATHGLRLSSAALARLRRSGRFGKVAALIAASAIIGGAYLVGGAPTDNPSTSHSTANFAALTPERAAAQPVPAASAAAEVAAPVDGTTGGIFAGSGSASKGQAGTDGQANAALAPDTTQIVKTGQMSLEVTAIDSALAQAQTAITGLGGLVDQSNRSGTGEEAVASITFRLPVAKWDAALPALRKIGSKVLSEQTGSTDVTSQVIDLNARIDNLKTTEAALQAIMARATAIPDVIAVETQLSDTQGQIEQLTAQRDHLADQAAMSTLTVTFQMPAKTVTTQATQDWTLGSQVDEAGAALVRIGQGLATFAVWSVLVVFPLGLAVLILIGVAKLTRRIFGRGGSRGAAAQV
jgi:hypothetical protein